MGVVLRHYKKTPETMKSIIVVLFASVATTLAANTCLQGWDIHEHHTGDTSVCHCYFFANEQTRVNHFDATNICKGKGGWLTEIEDSDWTHVDNQWIVDTLMEKYNAKSNIEKSSKQDLDGPHYEDQWWIGARSYTGHSEP